MYTALLVIHLLSCFTMVAVVLLQSGKGAEIGAAFGGSSQTLFGSRGAATFLSKVTVVAATVFMVTALSLAMLSKERSVTSGLRDLQSPAAAPAIPETIPPATFPVPGDAPGEAGSAPSGTGEAPPAPSPAR